MNPQQILKKCKLLSSRKKGENFSLLSEEEIKAIVPSEAIKTHIFSFPRGLFQPFLKIISITIFLK